MADYIARAELMKFPIRADHYDKEHGNEHFISGIETVLEYAGSLPTADVAPVVHGRWKHYRDIIICSRCDFGMYPLMYYFRGCECAGSNLEPKFCPYCGAKMEVDHD